jgi:hypothetical protein
MVIEELLTIMTYVKERCHFNQLYKPGEMSGFSGTTLVKCHVPTGENVSFGPEKRQDEAMSAGRNVRMDRVECQDCGISSVRLPRPGGMSFLSTQTHCNQYIASDLWRR